MVPLPYMLPVIGYIGSFAISSSGLFLALGFLYALFLIWRLSRAWDFEEEKVLDLLMLTTIGALVGARVYFIFSHLSFFGLNIGKMILFTKYPGLSFWGAFLGGWLVLNYSVKKFKLDFWSICDIAAIGFLASLIFGNVGCFLSGCGVGVVSDSFLAVDMVGFVGKRFPIQIVEAVMLAVLLVRMWPKAVRFHTPGKILSYVLMYSGAIKFFTEFFRSQYQSGHFFSLVMFTLGLMVFYRVSKRSLRADIKALLTDQNVRKMVLHKLTIGCYNALRKELIDKKILWSWKLNKLLRRLNVRTYPKNN